MKRNIIKLTTLMLMVLLPLSSCSLPYEGSPIEPGHWSTDSPLIFNQFDYVIESFEIKVEEVDQDIDYTDFVPEYGEIYDELGTYYLISFYMNGEVLVDDGYFYHVRGFVNEVYFRFGEETPYFLSLRGNYYNNKNGSYFSLYFSLSVYEDFTYSGAYLEQEGIGAVTLYAVE